MRDPKPIHLSTPDEVRAGGWLAEARDSDGHLITTISPEASDESLGEWLRECTRDGLTVANFPPSN
jgi:hypothetical protein